MPHMRCRQGYLLDMVLSQRDVFPVLEDTFHDVGVSGDLLFVVRSGRTAWIFLAQPGCDPPLVSIMHFCVDSILSGVSICLLIYLLGEAGLSQAWISLGIIVQYRNTAKYVVFLHLLNTYIQKSIK